MYLKEVPTDGHIAANPTDLQAGVTFEQQPSLTWYVDPHTRRIRGTADGLQAVTQAVEIMLTTERFYWQIYGPDFGMQWQDLIGQDPDMYPVSCSAGSLTPFRWTKRIRVLTI